MATRGNTVWLTADFVKKDGTPGDPTEVKIRIYDAAHVQIGTDIDVGNEFKVGTGQYEYPFIIPRDRPGPLFFEYQGNLEGYPEVGKHKIPID